MKPSSQSFIAFVLFVFILTSCRAGKKEVTAFVHVNLIPMTHESVVEDQTVLVEGTKIAAVGPSDEVVVPETASVIDGADTYLMPGLADMHMHTREDWPSDTWAVSPLNLYLANGVSWQPVGGILKKHWKR